MTTPSSSSLSPEAKEFVPVILNPSSTTIPTIYSSDQQAMIYPLMKYPEMNFCMPPNQQFHLSTNNTSQIMLLPTPGCYSATQIIYPPHEQSSVFYPTDYNPCSLMNCSLSHPNSTRISSARQQNGANHSNKPSPELTSLNDRRNFHSTNSKHQPKNSRARPTRQQYEQRKDSARSSNNDQAKTNGTLFKLRTEDFPSLPMSNSQSEKAATQSQTSVDTKLVFL